MDKTQRAETIAALIAFTIRASKEGATAEEIAVLPAVASLLLQSLLKISLSRQNSEKGESDYQNNTLRYPVRACRIKRLPVDKS